MHFKSRNISHFRSLSQSRTGGSWNLLGGHPIVRVQVPNNHVLGILVLVIVVQVLGRYRFFWY